MPTWGELLRELQLTAKTTNPPFDAVRRKYLQLLHEKTGRNVILYASNWTQPGVPGHPNILSIGDEDIQALMRSSTDSTVRTST